MEKLELKPVKVHVSIDMKTIEFIDEYVKMPTEEQILEAFAEEIRQGTQDENFEIRITAEE